MLLDGVKGFEAGRPLLAQSRGDILSDDARTDEAKGLIESTCKRCSISITDEAKGLIESTCKRCSIAASHTHRLQSFGSLFVDFLLHSHDS